MASTMKEEESELLAMQMVSASVTPMVLKAAMDLHVFDIIAEAGPGACLSPLEIASRLPTQNPDAPCLLDRMLRLLVSHSLLTCTVISHDHRIYGLAPASKLFIKDKDGGSLAPMFHIVQDQAIIKSWYHLKESILEGGERPFYKAHGESAHDYVLKDPKLKEVLGSLLLEYNIPFMKKFLDTYKGFEGLQVLVDVGGGVGLVLSMIISKYPSIKGINLDLPHVIERAPTYSGVEHVRGDLFASIPKGDAIFMKSIMHHYSDEQCVKLLKNCYEALPDFGKVIVVDLVVPTSPKTNATTKSILQMDMFISTMLNPIGRERTEEEYTTLAREAGFDRISVEYCAYTFSVMEFYKCNN
ncbi:caffeic acid 3-O-methyltransferase-like [Macadamia integrifolia]|uniref:caffeic acid 3-O-methyltransferase-like n=1 Tax=Macadamia integrifolia TaxID=60698 RepID=UPI001C4E4591|nr:caffeic acid 3-O-methyltransferase-like [Macadamia integrifolia]